MTAPAGGVERLMHFIDARLAQLNLSKEEVARRGGPSPDTLAKIRDRETQQTPLVRTLLRFDQSLGWTPGSSAVVLLGGLPLSLTARGSSAPKHVAAVTESEIVARLFGQFDDEITRLQRLRDTIDVSLTRLHTLRSNFEAEMRVDVDLVGAYRPEPPTDS